VWRRNNLSIVLLALFIASMVGQAWAGWYDHNQDEQEHGQPPIPFSEYLITGHFWEATGENWESEFLQMAAFVLLTCFLRQQGSAESKRLDVVEDVDLDPRRFKDEPDVPGPVKAGGWKLRLYEHSLGLTFALLFVASSAFTPSAGSPNTTTSRACTARPVSRSANTSPARGSGSNRSRTGRASSCRSPAW
jgi:hypothetical protein